MKQKHLRPPKASSAPQADSGGRRRTAFRFGFSAVIASFVVLGLLILGAMFQEEYEEGFVRLVSYAVRLASPEEIAQTEAQGPIPSPLPAIRPDTPVVASSDLLVDEGEIRSGQILLPEPETLVPIEDYVGEPPGSLEIVIPENVPEAPETADSKPTQTE